MGLQLTSYINKPIVFCIKTQKEGEDIYTRKCSMCLADINEDIGTLTYSIWDDTNPGSRRYATVNTGHAFSLNVNDADINHKVEVCAYENPTEYGDYEVSIYAPEEVSILRYSLYNEHMNERFPGRYERYLERTKEYE